MKKITAPLTGKQIRSLKAGELVFLSGIIYTARDQAHLRLKRDIGKNRKTPLDLKGQVIYYCGPTPSGKRAIGSCGPTTSGRMDGSTPQMLEAGVRGLIGKGRRSEPVRKAIKKHGAVYFLAPAGAGAYISGCVIDSRAVAYEELGPEAVYRLEVRDLPLIVGIDYGGKDLYSRSI